MTILFETKELGISSDTPEAIVAHCVEVLIRGK